MERYDIKVLFLTFIIYSFVGWLYETIGNIILNKKFVNRGFLIGPWIPIYGLGALFLIIITRNFTDKPFFLTIFTILLFSILEYVTSYFLEKVFKARWWDYSKRKFNLNGRICIISILTFSVMGLLMIYVINPFINDKLVNLDPSFTLFLSGIIFILFFTDSLISISVIYSIRKTANNIKDDDTEEVTEKVKQILLGKNYFSRRYISKYPKFYIKY